LIDPHAGLADLKRGQLRAVGEPARRFAEDGLRVLRAARFVATLEFELESETEKAIRPSLDTYRQVSAERVRVEWNKTLAARAPSRGFSVMRQHGMLEVTAPELQALSEEGRDLLAKALRRVDASPSQLEVRLAALLCDIGPTPAGAAHSADKLLSRLRYSNAERKRVCRLVEHRRLPDGHAATPAEVRRWLSRVGDDLYLDLLALGHADLKADHSALSGSDGARASLAELQGAVQQQLKDNPPLCVGDLAVGGKELMAEGGVPRGPAVGSTLRALLERVLDEPALNTKDALLALAREKPGG
jgi:tRNA nucleotidyltransferase (CCA-adding enzyme)